jgi:low affinity Fe/Cu permease
VALATLGMTLVMQRAEHRDTQAIHTKLDEVLHALGNARNENSPGSSRESLEEIGDDASTCAKAIKPCSTSGPP